MSGTAAVTLLAGGGDAGHHRQVAVAHAGAVAVGAGALAVGAQHAGFTPLDFADAVRIGSRSPVYVAGLLRREPDVANRLGISASSSSGPSQTGPLPGGGPGAAAWAWRVPRHWLPGSLLSAPGRAASDLVGE
jgi:hypothetical protein